MNINSQYTSAFLAVGKRFTLSMTVFIDDHGHRIEQTMSIDEVSFDSFIAALIRRMPDFSLLLEPVGLDPYLDPIARPGEFLANGYFKNEAEIYCELAQLVQACNRP